MSDIFLPIGATEFQDSIKALNKTMQLNEFYNFLFCRFISVGPYQLNNNINYFIEINLYTDVNFTNLSKTINPFTNENDRNLIFGINKDGFFRIPDNGFESSYNGMIFINIGEIIYQPYYFSYRFFNEENSSEIFYGIFPCYNIGSNNYYGYSDLIYRGYFSVSDNSENEQSSIKISNGVAYINDIKITVPENILTLSETENFPVEIRAIFSTDGQNYYFQNYIITNSDNHYKESGTSDILIATINKDGNKLNIIQQHFGEIESWIFNPCEN